MTSCQKWKKHGEYTCWKDINFYYVKGTEGDKKKMIFPKKLSRSLQIMGASKNFALLLQFGRTIWEIKTSFFLIRL